MTHSLIAPDRFFIPLNMTPTSISSWPRRLAPGILTLAVLAPLLLAGCAMQGRARARATQHVLESARQNNQAVSESLELRPGPADVHTRLAHALASQNERLLGAPREPLNVPALLEQARDPQDPHATNAINATNATAAALRLHDALAPVFAEQNRALARQQDATDRLVDRGLASEAAHNARLSFWARWIARLGLPLAALIALLVFVPALIPVFGRLLASLVAWLPSLAGYVGVVGTRAFDATVRGIEQWKTSASTPDAQSTLLDSLSRSMDAAHKQLVKQRKSAVAPAATSTTTTKAQ